MIRSALLAPHWVAAFGALFALQPALASKP